MRTGSELRQDLAIRIGERKMDMKKANPKERLFTLISYLNEIDENEPIVINDVLDYLCSAGLKTQRCTLIDDLNTMERFGFGVTHRNRKYYYRKSVFSLDELMLLADCICYSNYIDADRTSDLIAHLKSLTVSKNAEKLDRQSDIFVKPKPMNKLCIRNAGTLHRAITDGKKVRFGYLHYDARKRLVKRAGYQKTVSPYKLVWDNSQYYLIGIDHEKNDRLTNFRVDKLTDLSVLDKPTEPLKSTSEFYCPCGGINIEKYLRSIFFMFGSDGHTLKRVTMKIRENIVGAFIDKFGPDLTLYDQDEGWVEAVVPVQCSATFYGWLAQFGTLAEVLTPEIKDEYLCHLENIINLYR